MRFPVWVRLNIAKETLNIDKEYFASKFAEIIFAYGTPWVKSMTIGDLQKLHVDLMKCFDEEKEESK